MQFVLSSELYIENWLQLHTKYKGLFSIPLKSERKQGREQRNFITEEVFIYHSIYLYLILRYFFFV